MTVAIPRILVRTRVLIELLGIALFTGVYLGVFRDRPRYLDATLGLLAALAIALSYRQSLRLWQRIPRVPLAYTERLKRALALAAIFTVPVTVLFFIVGLALGYSQGGWPSALHRVLNWHAVPAAALYALWGLIQQFVFEFYLLGRLLWLLPPRFAIPVLALIFSAVHFPRVIVMIGVLIAAVVWANIYRRYRTLLPLALSHAILGTSLHYWVFGGDLWAQWVLRHPS